MAQVLGVVQACPTCCVPAHLLAPGRAPFHAPARNPAMVRDLAGRDPDCAAPAVVPSVLADAVTEAPEPPPDHSIPGIWEALWKDLSAERLPLTAVAADDLGQRRFPAGMKAERRAGHQTAADFFSGARQADQVPVMQNPFAVRTLSHAALRQGRGVDIGNVGCVSAPAAFLADNGSLNNAADRQVAVQGWARPGDPSGPIRFAAAPIHVPSVGPSAAGHPDATRRNRQGERGNSVREYAEQKAAPPSAIPAPTVRCTRNLRTSCRARTPSNCHRRRRNLNSGRARNTPGSRAPARVPGSSEH